MLEPYTLETDITAYGKEELMKYDDLDDNDHPVCDLSSFQKPWEEEQLLKSLDNLDVLADLSSTGVEIRSSRVVDCIFEIITT